MKKSDTRDKMKNLKKVMACVISAVLCVILLIVIYRFNNADLKRDYSEKFVADVKAAQLEYQDRIKKHDLYMRSNTAVVEDLLGFATFMLEENGGYTEENSQILAGSIGRVLKNYYFAGNIDTKTGKVNGKFMLQPDADKDNDVSKLNDEELFTLFSEGKYSKDGRNFEARRVLDDGYIVLAWNIEDILVNQSFLSNITSVNDELVFRVNIQEGTIGDCAIESLVGANIDEYMDLDELLRIEPYKTAYYDDAVVCVSAPIGDSIFVSYITKPDYVFELIRSILLPVVLGWIFIIVTLVYSLRFFKRQSEGERVSSEIIHLFGKSYVNRKLVSHVVGMVSFAVILIICSHTYARLLINYGRQNQQAEANLATLENLIILNAQNNELMRNDYQDIHKYVLDLIAEYYVRFPDKLDSDNISLLKNYMPEIESITIFDASGTCVFDTGENNAASSIGGTVGYTLSRDESSNEYACWDIINGEKEIVSYCESDDHSKYYAAGRRQDKMGIIRIGMDASVLDEFEELSTNEKVVAQADFGDDLKIYVDQHSPEYMYIFEPMKTEGRKSNNEFPEEVMKNDYSGVSRIGGVKYYVNTRNTDDTEYAFMSAKQSLKMIGHNEGRVILTLLIVFAVYGFAIIFLSARRIEHISGKKVKIRENILISQNIEEQMMDANFRKVVKAMLVITCVMIVILLAIDAFYARSSLLSYLFNNKWAKGLNLFSFTMIMFLFAAVILIGGLVQVLIIFFTKNMGPRGVTIGKLVVSVARFVVLLALVIAVIAELGVNLSTLLTSAGIFGAIITFTAQQSVNDFLMGFFIVFEGLFNVGDWITVNGFRGQVIEIGIRTTKIAVGDNVQIINNSSLKEVTLMAPNRSGAICEIDVAYGENIDDVINLLRDSKGYFNKEIPGILEGPFVDGVTGMSDSAVTITIWAMADQDKVNAVERDLRRMSKRLFNENNIEIPYKQVTIHQEK